MRRDPATGTVETRRPDGTPIPNRPRAGPLVPLPPGPGHGPGGDGHCSGHVEPGTDLVAVDPTAVGAGDPDRDPPPVKTARRDPDPTGSRADPGSDRTGRADHGRTDRRSPGDLLHGA